MTVDEPPEPRRIRRQPDLMRLLFESAMIVVVLLLGRIGVQTTSGLESDIHNGVQLAPSFLLSGITVLTNIITAIIPVGLAVERLARRDGKRVADAVIAAALAYGLTSLLNFWIESSFAPKWLLTELTRHVNSGTTSPLHIYISTLIAFLTVLGFNDRPTLRTFTWVSIGIYAVATLMSGDSALVGLIVTFLLGRLWPSAGGTPAAWSTSDRPARWSCNCWPTRASHPSRAAGRASTRTCAGTRCAARTAGPWTRQPPRAGRRPARRRPAGRRD